MKHPARRTVVGAVALMAAAGMTLTNAPIASAHVSASASSSAAGSSTVLTFSVPHGCEGSPTTAIEIKIPAEILSVTPTRNPLYTLKVVPEKLQTPVKDAHGNTVTERVGRVEYSTTTPLPDHQRDTFQLSMKLPTDAAGKTLYFPTLQRCQKGEAAWVQMPASGQSANDLDFPAPAVTVTAAKTNSASPSASPAPDPASTSGASSGAPWAVTILSLALGACGLAVGSFALARTRAR